ncbi:MAG: hypothetical protein ABI843_10365 [Dokdonella sp.]
MADADARARRRRRRWLIALTLLFVLGALVAFALHRYSRPEKLTAMLIEQTRSLLGAELELGGTGGFDFTPNLHLVLPKPSLKSNDAALLTAASLDVVVPWHTLWSDRIDIERIVVEHPVLDLDALSAWFAARPPSTSSADIRFALRVRDGVILSKGKPIAEGVNLQLANAGDLAGWLAHLRAAKDTTDVLPPLGGSADVRTMEIGATRIEGLHVEVSDDVAAPSTTPRKPQ